MEQRRCSRYAYRMKAKVESVETKSLRNPIDAWTRDVNSKGLLLELKKRLIKGTRIQVALHLPADVTGKPVLLWCVCRVVRTARSAVAVVIERYEYVGALEEN